LIRVGQLVLTVLVTWFVFERLGPGFDELRRVDAALWRPDVVTFVVSCVLLLLAYFMSAALWGRMVMDLGGPRLPVADAIRLFMVANLGRYLPGKVWQIAGLAMLARRHGVAARTATGAAALGQGMALAAAALVGTGALLGGPPELRRWGVPLAAGLVFAVLVGLVPPVFRRLASLWFRVARQELPETLGAVHAVRWFAFFVLNWGLYAFSFWVLAASFGHRSGMVPVASAFAAAYVLGYLALFAPAGVGVREGALIAFLTPHLGAPASGVLAVVARVWTTGVELVPAAAFWLRRVTVEEGEPPGGEDHGE
jgi:uncharacterized membrane protein YbhN (UPF0104 family)